jgi:hypothetical protein
MNWKRFTAFKFALLAVLLLSYQPTHAQSNVQAGSIQGVVTDPQGGVVPDAKVTIANKDTGAVLDMSTTSAGTFVSGSLVPGNYTLRVEAPSFKTVTATYAVQINQVSSATIKLELGATSTVVKVTDTAVAVNTDQAQVSGSLTTQQIENLPVNGRNFLDLAQLEPGVQIQDGGNLDPTKIGFSSISFGGRFGRSARISVDGVDVSDENVGTTTTAIPAGAIQEFQLAQSSLDLSHDLTSSGAVNVATKSGTNSVHGEGFAVKANFTLTYGLRYVRDTGRTDSDLNTTQEINNFFPGFGNPVRQPNKNFAPQVGFAWDPKSNGKTVIRGGIGLYYDNIVFNDVSFDRLLRLQNGAFNIVQTPCASGAASVPFGGGGGTQFIGGSNAAAEVICNTPVGATVGAGGGTCAGEVFATCLGNFQTAFQASYAGANPANAAFIPNALSTDSLITTGLLDPDYKSPRAVQTNIGVQHELRPGMVLSVDYLRNVGLHYLLGQDINHTGDIAYFNPTAAATAVSNTLTACGAGNILAAAAPGGCVPLHPISANDNGAATLGDFTARGLDSPYDLGIGACPANTVGGNSCAFPGINPAVGHFYMYRSGGRSVYNGMDIKLVQNIAHPFRGVKYLNFQFAYTLSRFVNAGSTASGTSAAGGDQDFVAIAINNRNPLALTGPSSLDRTHQFNLGRYADLPLGFRLGIISHFWSPLAITPTVLPIAGGAQSGAPGGIFQTDFLGSGQIGNPLPRNGVSSCGTMGGSCDYSLFDIGGYMRQVGPGGLTSAINNYNSTIAGGCGGGGCPTPAGQVLINNGIATLADLQALGAVALPISAPPAGQVPLAWLRGFDTNSAGLGTSGTIGLH